MTVTRDITIEQVQEARWAMRNVYHYGIPMTWLLDLAQEALNAREERAPLEMLTQQDCPACNGSGMSRVSLPNCHQCTGKGYIFTDADGVQREPGQSAGAREERITKLETALEFYRDEWKLQHHQGGRNEPDRVPSPNMQEDKGQIALTALKEQEEVEHG